MPDLTESAILKDLLSTLEARMSDRVASTEIRTSTAIADVADRNIGNTRSNQRTLFGGGVMAISVMSMFVGWVQSKVDVWDDNQKAVVDLVEAVERIEARQRNLDDRTTAISRQNIQQSQSIHDGFGWMSRKLDLVSTRAKSEQQPTSVREMADLRLDPVFSFRVGAR